MTTSVRTGATTDQQWLSLLSDPLTPDQYYRNILTRLASPEYCLNFRSSNFCLSTRLYDFSS